jgi:hypothetical protein
MLAIRLIPYRDDFDALFGGQLKCAQLRPCLVGEPIAHTDCVLLDFLHR